MTLDELNKKHAEEQKLQNELLWDAMYEAAIIRECDEIALESYEEQKREAEVELRHELELEQRHQQGEIVLQVADRNAVLDGIKADILLVAGVPQEVFEQLFNIFKKSQDELLAEGITLEKQDKSTLLIKFPSHPMALNFLQFLLQIQEGKVPDVPNKHLCMPYLGLTLIAELGKAIANDASQLAQYLNPFKMRLEHSR